MPDETKPAANTETKPKADETKPAAKPVSKAEVPALAIGESSGNLTRDSIIEFQRSKHIEAGKSEDEAQRLAVKRGFEMIKE